MNGIHEVMRNQEVTDACYEGGHAEPNCYRDLHEVYGKHEALEMF